MLTQVHESGERRLAVGRIQSEIPRKISDLMGERGMRSYGVEGILDDLTDRATRDARAAPIFKGRTRQVARAQRVERFRAMEVEADRERCEVGTERYICGDP